MSNNLLTSNTYYTASQFVDSKIYSSSQVARTDDNLLFPIIDNASNYNVALAKCNVPLSTIPLTKSNIPLKQYQITLRNGTYEASAYLRQLNASNSNFLWNCSDTGLVTSYTYTSAGSMILLSSVDMSSFVPNGVVYFCVDDFKNMYMATSSIPYGLVDRIVVVNITSVQLLATLSATSIQAIDLDRQNRLYVADEIVGSSVVKVYNNANSDSSINLTLSTTITNDFFGNQLSAIRTISTDESLIVGYDNNRFCIYNIQNFQAITGFQNTTISHLGKASAINSSGEGSFCLVDNTVDDSSFTSVRSPAVGANLWNDNTNQLFGDGGSWKLNTKIAWGSNKAVGVGTDGASYYFNYDSTTGQATSGPYIYNNLVAGLTNVSCCESRNNYLMSSSAQALYATNIDNLGVNNLSLLTSTFGLGGQTPLSWEYQPHTRKIIALDATTFGMNITAQPVFPKNFFSITQPVLQTYLSVYGCGANDNSQGLNTVSLINNGIYTLSNSGQTMLYYDACPVQNGIVAMVGIQMNTTNYFLQTYSLLTGAIVNTWPIYANQPVGIIHLGGNFTGILFTDGTLKTYNYNTGANAQTIATGLATTSNPVVYISGGQDISIGRKVIFITSKGILKVYTSLSNGSGYVNVLTSTNAFVPNGGSNYQFMGPGYFHGDGQSATPNLYLMTSGSNTNPVINPTMQAIVKVGFTDNTYSALNLATTIQIIDNQSFAFANGWNTVLTGSYRINEMYVGMSNNTVGIWNNELRTYNILTATQTSKTTLDATVYSQIPSFYSMESLYTFNNITVTGMSTQIQGIAINRQSPNTIYLLDNTGAAFKGQLNGFILTVTPYTSISTVASKTSLNISQDGVTYDSYVKCYTVSNQRQIGSSSHFQGQKIKSICRNDVTLDFTISVEKVGFYMYTSDSFEQTGVSLNSQASLAFTKAGEDIDAGPASIYDYTVFVNALNSAFDEAYTRLKGNGGVFISSPQANLDYGTQLYTLNYNSDYTKATNGILFNDALLRLVRFYSVKDSGLNKLMLPLNSTSMLQTSKSAYKFNKLTKIVFQSTTIFVIGSYAGSNSQNQTLMDVDVPIDDFIDNQGEILFYQPTLLRPYVLGSTNSIQRVELRVFYQYNDGTQFNLEISPDDSWSSLFCFVRKL